MSEKDTPRTRAEIEADLAAQRAALTSAVDDLTQALDPRTQVAELKEQSEAVAANLRSITQEFAGNLKAKDPRALGIAGAVGAGVLALGLVAALGRRRNAG